MFLSKNHRLGKNAVRAGLHGVAGKISPVSSAERHWKKGMSAIAGIAAAFGKRRSFGHKQMKLWKVPVRRLVIGLAAILGLGLVYFKVAQGDRLEQPIAFNHQKHIENHVQCITCHPLYETHTRAGIPGVKTCLRCHEDVIYRTPEKDKIQRYASTGEEIPWQRVYRVKPFTYFSHRRHTAIAKLDCSDCHGDMARMATPLARQFLEIKMQNCLECHRRSHASVDCVDCHR